MELFVCRLYSKRIDDACSKKKFVSKLVMKKKSEMNYNSKTESYKIDIIFILFIFVIQSKGYVKICTLDRVQFI